MRYDRKKTKHGATLTACYHVQSESDATPLSRFNHSTYQLLIMIDTIADWRL